MKLLSSAIISFFLIVITVDSLITAAAAVVTATSTEDNSNINMINRRPTRQLREQQQQKQHQYNNNENNNSNNRNLIVGGQQAKVGDYPYYVGFGGDWWCGGSLISSEFVLTAAHCQFGVGDDVYIGDYESQTTKEGITYKRQCIEWIEDPRFVDGPPLYYDFALCRLNEPITIDQTRTTLLLNSDPNYPPPGSNITLIGMGSINDHPFPAPVQIPKYDDTIDINTAAEEDSPNSNTDDYGGYVLRYPKFLQEVTSQIISNEECRESEFAACESLPMETCITDSEICNLYKYGSLEDGQDACWGDSGGPVISRIDQGDGTFKDIHVGIVSWGDYCGNSDHPNINARTSSAFDFIKTIVCDQFGTNPDDASFCGGGDDGTNNGVDVGGEGDESTTNLRPPREKMRDREKILQSSRLTPLD